MKKTKKKKEKTEGGRKIPRKEIPLELMDLMLHYKILKKEKEFRAAEKLQSSISSFIMQSIAMKGNEAHELIEKLSEKEKELITAKTEVIRKGIKILESERDMIHDEIGLLRKIELAVKRLKPDNNEKDGVIEVNKMIKSLKKASGSLEKAQNKVKRMEGKQK